MTPQARLLEWDDEERRHVSLMDLCRAVRAAGIEEPVERWSSDLHPIPWRPADEEVAARVWESTLYAVRRACPDAPPAPPAHPPEETDEERQAALPDDPDHSQATLSGVVDS